MERELLSRRRFGATVAALTAVGLAGCSDDDGNGDDENDDVFEQDDPGSLTLYFETEDGEPVSTGVRVRIEHVEEDYGSNYEEGLEDGELADVDLLYEGEYTVTAESTDDEFDDVEVSITLEEDEDEEETLVLEGATPDSELEGEGENGVPEEDEENDETDEEAADDENGENNGEEADGADEEADDVEADDDEETNDDE